MRMSFVSEGVELVNLVIVILTYIKINKFSLDLIMSQVVRITTKEIRGTLIAAFEKVFSTWKLPPTIYPLN